MSKRLRRGLGVGASAGVLVLTVEVLLALSTGLAPLGGRDVLRLLAVAWLFGGGVGAALGALIAALTPTTGRRQGWAIAVLATPAIAWGASHLFDGPRAQRVPGKSFIAVGVAAVILALLGWTLGRYLSAPRHRRWVMAWVVVVVALGWVDHHVLPRLYPWFHVELALAGAAAAALAALAWSPTPDRRWTAALLATVLLAVPSLWWLDRQRPTRLYTLEHTPQLGRAVAQLRSWRLRPVASSSPELAVPSAPVDWPHLGDVDLVVISVDAWRADRLNPTVTPHMDELANRGVRFERAYTEVPHTSFGVATLLTGRHVAAEVAAGGDLRQLPTLASLLRAEHYKTAAFYPPSVFYVDRARLAAFESSGYDFEYVKLEYLDAARRTDQVIAFFEAERPRRALVWVHYLEPHEPYEPHAGITTSADSDAARYDGELLVVDREVARLVDWLGAHRGRSVVVLTADHGEEFGEHGGRYHGTTLYEEQIRVPWVMFSLGAEPRLGPARVRQPVSSIDLTPTLLALADVARPSGMASFGVPSLGDDRPASRPVFAELGTRRAVIDGNDKLICDLAADSCQLFDLQADPHEHAPRVDHDGEATEARLRLSLAHFATVQAQLAAPDPVAATLARARQGDAKAVAELGLLVAASQPIATRLRAARVWVEVPASRLPPTLGTELARDPDPRLALLGRLLAARLGAKALPSSELDGLCHDPDHALCARAALLSHSVPHLGAVLPLLDDEGLALEVIEALGRSGDRGAFDALLVRLGTVRTRRQTVEALEQLGQPEIVETLARWAPADPYTPVRAAMAHALGVLGKTAPASARAEAVAALEQLASEREGEVRAAGCAALRALGQLRRGCTDEATHPR